jgi:hypothetical protein
MLDLSAASDLQRKTVLLPHCANQVQTSTFLIRQLVRVDLHRAGSDRRQERPLHTQLKCVPDAILRQGESRSFVPAHKIVSLVFPAARIRCLSMSTVEKLLTLLHTSAS